MRSHRCYLSFYGTLDRAVSSLFRGSSSRQQPLFANRGQRIFGIFLAPQAACICAQADAVVVSTSASCSSAIIAVVGKQLTVFYAH